MSNTGTLRRFNIAYEGGVIGQGVMYPDGVVGVRTLSGGRYLDAGIKQRLGGQAALDETVGKLNKVMSLLFPTADNTTEVRWLDN